MPPKPESPRLPAALFHPAITLSSGQVFHWDATLDGGFEGLIGAMPTRILPSGSSILVPCGDPDVAARYFALDHPLEAICATFPSDPAMRAATDACRGMRIIRQPPWECLATFITSALKQVPHIRAMSFAIRARWGLRIETPSGPRFAYPPPERIAAATETELRACGLGFRAKHLLATARAIADGRIHLDAIASMPDPEARAALCTLPGVGEKVANCVLLFAFGRLAAFPVDTWIHRILSRVYFPHARNLTPKRLRDFAASYFGPYGGYAQQYLFHHARTGGLVLRPARKSPKILLRSPPPPHPQ